MGQEDVYSFLKENSPKRYTSNQIAYELNLTKSSIHTSVKKLFHKFNLIEMDTVVKEHRKPSDPKTPVRVYWVKTAFKVENLFKTTDDKFETPLNKETENQDYFIELLDWIEARDKLENKIDKRILAIKIRKTLQNKLNKFQYKSRIMKYIV